MSEIQLLIQWISELLSEYLYPGVFLAALIETIILQYQLWQYFLLLDILHHKMD